MSAHIRLVMFDLDGTLVETGNEIAQAVNDTLHEFDLSPVSQHQVDGWIGSGTLELLVTALAYATRTPAEVIRKKDDLAQIKQRFDLHYQRHCGTISRLYPQVREVLVELKSRGVKLAVVTNKDMHYTRIVLNAHQLHDMFDAVIGGDSMPARKPDPAGIHHCLRLFDVAPDAALFVGDSSIDAAAAKNAGVKVWLLTYGYNMHRPVAISEPDRVIDTVWPLLQQI